MEKNQILQSLKERFESEPFAARFGIRILELEKGEAVVEMDVEKDSENIFKMAHGGAIFALIDSAFELAGNSSGIISVALNMNISYTKAVRPGDRLTARALEINTTRKTGLYNIDVKNQDDEMVASSQATVYRLEKPLPWLSE